MRERLQEPPSRRHGAALDHPTPDAGVIRVFVERRGGIVRVLTFHTRLQALVYVERASASTSTDIRTLSLFQGDELLFQRRRTEEGFRDAGER